MSLRMVQPESTRLSQHAVLKTILRRCQAEKARGAPVVVFDLDGTLVDNRPRTLAILREFAARHRHRDSDAAERLENARAADLAYLLTDSLRRMGMLHSDLAVELEAFWRDRFFADGHLMHDAPLPGARDFAHACYASGAVVVYLTGRDLPLMGTGTFQSLRDLGFPIGLPGTELVLKPDAAMPDEAFKRLTSPDLARIGHVIAAFDNEPANCNVFRAYYPDAHVVFVDTQHAPGAPLLEPGVHVVRDFRVR